MNTNSNKNKKRDKGTAGCFIYVRTSSDDERDQREYIKQQTKACKEIAKCHKLTIKKIFTESGSAEETNCRPVFEDMLRRINKGEARYIVSYNMDCLTRNIDDLMKLCQMIQQGSLNHIVISTFDLTEMFYLVDLSEDWC